MSTRECPWGGVRSGSGRKLLSPRSGFVSKGRKKKTKQNKKQKKTVGCGSQKDIYCLTSYRYQSLLSVHAHYRDTVLLYSFLITEYDRGTVEKLSFFLLKLYICLHRAIVETGSGGRLANPTEEVVVLEQIPTGTGIINGDVRMNP